MKSVIQHFVFAFFLLLATASFCVCLAQSQTPAADDLPEMIKLQIKGINIENSYHEDVLRQFGKPLSSKKSGTNPCGSTKLTLRYPGLTINLDPDENEQNFFVVFAEITSPEWEVSGIRVGASLEDVRAKFGKSSELRKESKPETIWYYAGDGGANFYFRKNKLVKITWEMNLC